MTAPARELTRLQAIIRLAYAMREDEEAQLARGILDQRQRAWVESMREEAAKVGYRGTIPLPSGEELDLLRRESITDAHSIRQTYNADLERAIITLYDANPRGNRNYYITGIERWHARRSEWKNRQIALYNNKTARYWAQQAFVEHNLARGRRYVFSGPAPVCEDCRDKFAAGEVGQDYVDRYPTPLHPNCPHEWQTVRSTLGVPLQQLWIG